MTTSNHSEKVFREGIGLDGSSVSGFADIDESDLMLIPDRSTTRITPSSDHTIAFMIADVYRGFGQGRLSKDPRYVSQRMEGHLREKGLSCQIGSEVECFIFDDIVFEDNADKRGKSWDVMNQKLYR